MMKTVAEEKAQELVKTGVIKPSQVKTFVMAYNMAVQDIAGAPKPAEPEIETNEAFETDFKEYEKENPKYMEYLTDSTYFELMDWYDFTHETETEKDEDGDIVCASDEAHEFAKYVWVKILGLEW